MTASLRRRCAQLLPALSIFLAGQIFALPGAEQPSRAGSLPSPPTPKIVLVLSGGGARGAGHVGVLQALEEYKIPIHGIVGTSMGAVIGGLYAAGYSPDQLEHIISTMDWADILDDTPRRRAFRFRRKAEEEEFLVTRRTGVDRNGLKLPRGLIEGHKLKAFLNRKLMHTVDLETFDDLNIPFRAVATDIGTGTAVILKQGNLANALFASMAIPAFFTPLELDGRSLVDGGVSDNLPVDVALSMGADFVIAVDLSSPLKPASELPTLLDITDQLTSILTRGNTEPQIARLKGKGLLIVPDIQGISSLDFDKAYQAISAGYRAAQNHLPELRHLAVAEPHYRPAKLDIPLNRIPVEEIVLKTDSRVDTRQLESRLAIEPGDVALNGIEGDLNRLYGMDLFSEVGYEYRDGRLVIRAKKREWGPDYLQFGVRLNSDFKGNSSYSLGLAFTATELNDSAGEWRSELAFGEEPLLYSEFFQPLGAQGRWFIAPSIRFEAFEFGEFEGIDEVTRYQLRRGGLDLDVGRELGTTGELRVGAHYARGTLNRLVGTPTVNQTSAADEGYVFGQWRYYSLDRVSFPREGEQGRLRWTLSRESLGAISDFQTLDLSLAKAVSRGDNTVLLSLDAASTTEGRAPLHQQYFAGGFLNLSGLKPRQLSGQHGFVLRSVYYYRWHASPLLPAYIGASLEAGNVWQNRDQVDLGDLLLAGSLFLGFDTLIGPVYLGSGLTEQGDGSFYVLLGKPF